MCLDYLHLLGITDSETQAARDGNSASKHLGRWEGLALGEHIKCSEDDHALQCVADSGRDWAETAEDDVLHVVVQVEGHAAHEHVEQEWVEGSHLLQGTQGATHGRGTFVSKSERHS